MKHWIPARRSGKSGISVLLAASLLALSLLTACSSGEPAATLASAATAPVTVPETVLPETVPETLPEPLPPMPEDYDLPVSQLPEAYPDLHGIADLEYDQTPRLDSPTDMSRFMLNRFLHGQFRFDFRMARDLAPSEGEATATILGCIEAAQCYYPFTAYREHTLCIEETGDPDWVLAHVELRYENPDYDLEARAEALEYVQKHPVPVGGFRDYSQEMLYCKDIHDYLIRRISYDPIGYDPMDMLNSSQYDNKQEAYNVLVSEDTSAVCAGYAKGFALIAQYAGIDCAYVTGNEVIEPVMESHAWNVVYPCDGSQPVTVDVTWDDPDELNFNGEPLLDYGYFYLPMDDDYEHTLQWQTQLFLWALHE